MLSRDALKVTVATMSRYCRGRISFLPPSSSSRRGPRTYSVKASSHKASLCMHFAGHYPTRLTFWLTACHCASLASRSKVSLLPYHSMIARCMNSRSKSVRQSAWLTLLREFCYS